MKKIKMNLQNLDNAEVLTREQLKKVLGGTVGSTSTPAITTAVKCKGRCTKVNFPGSNDLGSCGVETITLGPLSGKSCECSVFGGVGCPDLY